MQDSKNAKQRPQRATDNFRGLRVTVMGLGGFGGGVGVTRWLAAQGARVTVTDQAPAEKLASSLEQVADLGVTLKLGGHDENDFTAADVVVVNPAVPDTSPFLQAARDAGVPISTEMNLFVERCRGRTVGITGSVGKSTTTAMIGHILEAGPPARRPAGTEGNEAAPRDANPSIPQSLNPAPHYRVWVGGNIGRSLLDVLPEIAAEDVVVLELSSFQLHRTPLVGWSPHVAVLTNVAPNHLDWHGDYAAYVADKLNILRFQDPSRDHIVLGDSLELRQLIDQLFGDTSGAWRCGLAGDVPIAVMQSTSAVDCDDRRLRWEGVRIGVPGRHNRQNAAVALAVAHCLGVPQDTASAALATFTGLPHRLNKVAEIAGVTYYDDSKSTTPDAALTALAAMEGPVLIILGGYDKRSDMRALAAAVAQQAKFAACIGKTGAQIAELVQAAGGQATYSGDLTAAVAACRAQAAPGDSVLLSPACASWDQFKDYRARGEAFRALALGK